MKDRASLYPGRVKLVPVAGQENTYDMIRADNPTQEGDPLNKNTLLKDATAALFGLGNTALPDDVFAAIKTMLDGRVRLASGTYVGTGKFGENNPCSLTFPFVPKLVIVYNTSTMGVVSGEHGNDAGYYAIIPNPVSNFKIVARKVNDSYYFDDTNTVIFSENTLKWYMGYSYSDNPAAQLNDAGTTYGYIAIGGGAY